MKKYFTLIIALHTLTAHAQIINTIIGNGNCTAYKYVGDTTQADSIALCSPGDITRDDTGNLYIADFGNSMIYKMNPEGKLYTIAGTGTTGFSGDSGLAINAQINHPVGIAIDANGNIYFSDEDNVRIRKIDPTGIITTIAGTGWGGYNGDGAADTTEFSNPQGIALDKTGSNLYIADLLNNRVRKLNLASGLISTVAGNGVAGSLDSVAADSAEVYNPADVTLDTAGNIYIAEEGASRIRKVDTTGFISTVAGYFSVGGYTSDSIPAISSELYHPCGIAVDGLGNLYIADTRNNRIRKVIPAAGNIITTIAGTGVLGYSGDGGEATLAELYYPFGVIVDDFGNLYFSDYNNYRIRWIKNTTLVNSVNSTSENIKIYPDPAYQQFTVYISSNVREDVKIIITNIIGQKIEELKSITNNSFSITLEVAPGVYFISASTIDKIYQGKVIIKQ